MSSAPVYRRDAPPVDVAALDARASWEHRAQIAGPDRPRTEHQQRKREAAARSRVYVRGRYAPSGVLLWDVLVADAPGRVRVALAGCWFREEAVAKAVDLLRGRVSVSFGGGAFRLGRGLLAPERGVRGLEATGLRQVTAAPGEAQRIEVVVR